MTKEKRYYEKQRFAQRRMWMLLATILFITIGSAVFGSSFSDAHGNAQESPITYKYYKSIVIQPGVPQTHQSTCDADTGRVFR